MTQEQKEYIEQNIDLIKNNEWTMFFAEAPSAIGSLLLRAGVNFMVYIEEIPEGCFKMDRDLRDIIMPNNLRSIGNYAFHNCSSLTSVKIGNNVTNIGGWAFYNCLSLRKATINNPFAIFKNNVFYNVSADFELHGYKDSTTEEYANANRLTFVAID